MKKGMKKLMFYDMRFSVHHILEAVHDVNFFGGNDVKDMGVHVMSD